MVKYRKFDNYQQVGHYSTIPGSPAPIVVSGEDSVMRLGLGGHYGYPDFPPDRDVGGDFFLNKYSYYGGLAQVGTIRSGSSRYIGAFRASWPSLSKYTDILWKPTVQDTQNAYNRMKPAQPSFEALNAIYELKDLPHMLKQQLSHNNLKDIGNYYLALQFGWKPLLRDIRNMYNTQRIISQRIKQLLRDNGRPVRRRVSVRTDSATTYASGQSYGAFAPTISTGFYQGYTPTYQDTTVTEERIWASAQFRYWLPEGPKDINWTNQMKARILGSNTPSPKNVWDAIPWTWLTDWFVDIGSMIETMDVGVADRLAADYMYIMRELSVTRTRESTGYFRHAAGDYFYASATGVSHATVKARVRGTPYGWNVNENLLSATQLSILGALGLSRLN